MVGNPPTVLETALAQGWTHPARTWLHSLGQSWRGALGSLHTLPIGRSQCAIRAFTASLPLRIGSHSSGSPVGQTKASSRGRGKVLLVGNTGIIKSGDVQESVTH